MTKPSEIVQDESLELAPLLDASAHPKLYQQNGFRVLELPIDASARDLTKRRQIVEAATANALHVPPGPCRILPLDSAPDAFAAREAVQRLTDPERRLVDEFFWFWPHQLGATQTDEALAHLTRDDTEAASEVWRDQEQNQSASHVSSHNLAVLYHSLALDWENTDLNGEATESDRQNTQALWKRSFSRWQLLIKEEGFWSRLSTRIREFDDPRLTTGTSRRIRAGLPLTLMTINAQLALKAAEHGKFDLAKRQVNIIRASGFSQTICDTALALAIESVRSRLKSLCKTANKEASDNPEKANEAAGRLLEQSKGLLAIVDCLLPEAHPTRGAVHDDVAIAGMDCSIAFGNKTNRHRDALALFETMLPIPVSKSAKERLKNNYEIIKGNVESDQCFFCKKNDKKDGAAVEVKMHGDIQRIPIYNGTRTTWRHIAIKVPRCSACKGLQAKRDNANVAVGLGGVLAVILGCFACGAASNSEWGGFFFCLPASILAGYWCFRGIKSKRALKGAGSTVSHKEYPAIKKLLADGWTWGDRPA